MMEMTERPPYVRFETRSIEDRAATIAGGVYKGTDIHYAIITPQGGRDTVERVATEWLDYLDVQAASDRFPPAWATGFRDKYKSWLAGEAEVVEGTSLNAWPLLSPSQLKTLKSIALRSVEDLASANEQTLARLGMGGRALKQKAVDWLASSKGGGKLVEGLAASRAENDALKLRCESLEDQLKILLARMESPAQANTKL